MRITSESEWHHGSTTLYYFYDPSSTAHVSVFVDRKTGVIIDGHFFETKVNRIFKHIDELKAHMEQSNYLLEII